MRAWSVCFLVAIGWALFGSSSVTGHEGPDGHSHEPAPVPRVLILGDSISIGYTPFVKERLAGRADVVRPDENCGPTTHGLAKLDEWLGSGPWSVVHFNFGLHDLKYVDAQGDRVPPEQGTVQVPLDVYERNLKELVSRLRATGAKLIWCTTTPVPPGAHGRNVEDTAKYNAVAAKVMRMTLGEERVINDLHAFVVGQSEPIQLPANVHFSEAGSRLLAEQVATFILAQLEPPVEPTEIARGIVYQDHNSNGVYDSGDQPLPGMRVSNGQLMVQTDTAGRYELPVGSDDTVFVVKPRGFRTRVDDNQLPRFYYTHKPAGSRALQFPGVAPTGPLPTSIDFPLYPQREPDQFKAILFGDPQPRDQREVDYVAHDVVEELVGTDASFGVTLGDITFDNLALFEPQARAIAVLGIPWYNVIGNHDVNYDALNDRESDESFERVFGPNYYSFDYGPVHFLVLDDVEWLIDESGEGRYQGGLGPRQMEFVRRDLALIPGDQLVVLMMHIPLVNVRDRHELFRLIEQRPFSMSISAHAHTHEHRLITQADGWRGPEPHRHVINVTVSGSWWSGVPDERGIPHAMMADGAPNGYTIIRFDGHRYSLDFKAAGRGADDQMAIHCPEVVKPQEQPELTVFANVFNGAPDSQVELQVDDAAPQVMTYSREADPGFVSVAAREQEWRDRLIAQGVPEDKLWIALPKPAVSTHLWKVTLDTRQLKAGVHRLRVSARLGEDQLVTEQRLFRIE